MNHFLMKTTLVLFVAASALFSSCSKDDEPILPPAETGNKKTFNLFSTSTGTPIGTATFSELEDNTTKLVLSLTGLPGVTDHPAHIHTGSGADGGTIAISLVEVDGSSGKSETIISKKDDGTAISYDELIELDGHINIHLSESDLSTLVAQGDIGPNAFTLNAQDFELFEVGGSGVSGDITFVERESGVILIVLALEGTPAGGNHPAHIHLGTAASGGSIAISLNNVNGDTGYSLTDISALDDGTPVTFSQLKEFNGHAKVHLSSAAMGTIVAAGDIGNNKLTGDMKIYPLGSVAVEGISGTATFMKRKSGATLVQIQLENTPESGVHPSHIHSNSAVVGGGVIIPLNNVNGTTGIGLTDVTKDKNDNLLTYDDLMGYDGHVMVHLSSAEMGTIVAKGDIGANALTGEKMVYNLGELNGSGISGTVTFEQRNSGLTLATILLNGTPEGGNHPAHIHSNSLAAGGGIVIDLNNINGNTGKSQTHIAKNRSEEPVTYEQLLNFNGHVKVHLSPDNIGSVVAGGNIGSNSTTGSRVSYANDIRPILDSNCQISPCHGSNAGIPNWSTYTTVSANAASIKNATGSKIMPPASSGKSLTADQIAFIANWVDDGAQNN